MSAGAYGTHETVDPIYGTTPTHPIAYHKDRMGCIPAKRKFIARPGTSTTISLTRLAQPRSDTDYLRAQIFYGGWGTRFYTIELRQFAGYDGAGVIPGEPVVLHKVDTLTTTRNNAEVVDGDGNGDCNDEGAMWKPGETYSDTVNGVTIPVDSAASTGVKVSITVSPDVPLPEVVSNSGDEGPGSLRNALHYANESPGSAIRFNLASGDPSFSNGAFTIRPTAPLPWIQGTDLVLDGGTQAARTGDTNGGRPLITLDGSRAGSNAIGLQITGSGCQVRRLTIGGFSSHGVMVMADTYAERLLSEGTTGNSVQGCFIGVNANGTAALANGGYGIGLFAGAAGNRIGGVTPGAGNVIAGNKDYGVLIGGEGTDRNVVQGNLVGTDATGGRALPNGSFGILVYGGARDNTIGGTVAGAGNVISGNRSVGVSLTGSGTDGNVMQGNWIGSDAAGLVAIPNSSAGIQVSGGAKGNVIGGTALRTGNLISGNTGHGVSIVGDGTTGTVVQGNFIGTDITGTTPLANTVNGVDLAAGAQNNTVGGSNSGAGNRIGGNRGSGIFVTGATTLGNALRGNLLFRNGALGINLVGGTQNSAQVTANDAGDADTGPNNLQNYPVITAATIAGGETILTGTLNSTPGATFALDFFASPEAHTSGYGEGAVYLGSATVTADASGNAAFEFRAPGSLVNQFITTTATNGTTGDTSEFSQAKKAS